MLCALFVFVVMKDTILPALLSKSSSGPAMDSTPGSSPRHPRCLQVEANRGGYNDIVTAYDLADAYLPAFRRAVTKGKAAGIMCSYNAINGVPTCASQPLNSLLRDTWGFDGYITSDSGSIADISGAHHYVKTAEQVKPIHCLPIFLPC